jgi:hypothetical protein
MDHVGIDLGSKESQDVEEAAASPGAGEDQDVSRGKGHLRC